MIVNYFDDVDGGDLTPIKAAIRLGWLRIVQGHEHNAVFVVNPHGELAPPPRVKQRMALRLRKLIHLGEIVHMLHLLQPHRHQVRTLLLKLLRQNLMVIAELSDLGAVELDVHLEIASPSIITQFDHDNGRQLCGLL